VRTGSLSRPIQVSTRNAAFQQWQSLLTNRTKRLRAGEFLVHGVRPISIAVQQGWTIRALLHDGRPRLSSWAEDLWSSVPANHVVLAPELMQELGEKPEGAPELIAVVEMRSDDLSRIPAVPNPLITVFDRPSNPGNIGTLTRSVDAFGGTALLITGHAADPFDPKSIRASTGSIFGPPVLRIPSHQQIFDWIDAERARGVSALVIGTDETARTDLRDADLTQPLVIVVGNETTGMTAAWRERCDLLLSIPMGGTASSLNAATAGAIVLYETMRQRAS